jgi:endonuclease/exonuclease/phosphatase family metal-dependent hydrolase
MRIITWNIFNKNEKIKSSLNFIFKYNPDIVCLQEFPEESLDLLNQKEYHFVNAKDCTTITLNKKNQTNSLLIIGIKRKIKHSTEIFSLKMPANNIIKKITNLKESLEGLKITFTYKNNKISLFNCHLSFAARPFIRRKELRKILKNGNGRRIICGDFNDFGNPFLNLFLGPFLNYRLKDYKINEIKYFERIFKKYKFNNWFFGEITHPISRQQLDYLLLSKELKIKNKEVLSEGSKFSDHLPLLVDLK